jgi:hypothetical protein
MIKKFSVTNYFMENPVLLHYAVKWFFTYSEKLIGSLSKNGQGNSMSKNPKRAKKFFRSFMWEL